MSYLCLLLLSGFLSHSVEIIIMCYKTYNGLVLPPLLLSSELSFCCFFFFPLLTKPSSHIGVLAVLWLHKTFSHLRAFAVAGIIFLTFCWVFTHKLSFQKDFLAIYVILFPDLLFFLSTYQYLVEPYILIYLYCSLSTFPRIYTGQDFLVQYYTFSVYMSALLIVSIHCLLKKWITHNWLHQNEMKLLTYSRQHAEEFIL